MTTNFNETLLDSSTSSELHEGVNSDSNFRMSPMVSSSPLQMSITVVGSGEMGRALGCCLSRAGYRVLLATRNPDSSQFRVPSDCGEVVSVSQGLRESNVLVLAVPPTAHANLTLKDIQGKIVIDISNRPSSRVLDQHSNIGQSLQNLLPDSHVVKAFNTLSAYSMLTGLQQGTTRVPYCGNDATAKKVVGAIIRNLGYLPDDRGPIERANQIEDLPFVFFPEWRVPIIIAAVITVFFSLILILRRTVCPLIDSGGDLKTLNLSKMILQVPQLAFSLAAFTLLALCYIPGVLAAYLQLYRRTKYSQFPNWLDKWLKCRKQLGLLALYIGTLHAIAAIVHVILDHDDEGTFTIYSYYISGIFSFGLMLILGITSLPSVGAALSWQEFSFVQRYGGWWALTFTCLHAIFLKWGKLFQNLFECVVVADQVQIGLVVPLLTLLLKLPLLLPSVDRRLRNIRAGQGTQPKNMTV